MPSHATAEAGRQSPAGATRGPAICFLTGTLNVFGGAERMTATVANELARRGHCIHILSLSDHRSCFPLDPAVRHETLFDQRPSFRTHFLHTVAGIRRYVRQHGIALLVEVDPLLTLFTLPACLGLGVRRIAWEHCNFDQDLGLRWRRIARRLSARTCERIVVLTELDREKWVRRLHCSNVEVIPNSLTFPVPAEPAARTSRTAVAVGRLTDVKGFDVLLQAWVPIARAFPDWRLRIVGNGELLASLTQQRDRLGLQQCVRLEPARSDIEAVYRDAAMLCLSSRYEGFSLVLVEAMAYGLPIVATNCETGVRALLTHGQNARLSPVDDAAALAREIAAVIGSPELAARLADAGRRNVHKFAPAEIAVRWEGLLSRISGETGRNKIGVA
ncbi:glycosyltransferase family 4 protein [Cupriavidus consociatus]|uniref:glycosyltransferase family 4 protein n=1 Tax=Cupriavidus consociatus TaxID=2821357 RepID=UPI001AE7A21D|nr:MULTISPECIES: glycosyltransferase family 4 protein [unclassified Cupriavidus]MBP0623544.1 glycosyltransferase family 4 protein [Cupriavidus sp. LEh25]MDK2660245.1 glycosyltransferase family 4 protein [Cupriavidus sp. LEh21]